MTLPFFAASLDCAGAQCEAETSASSDVLIQRHIQHDGVQHGLGAQHGLGGVLACEAPQTRRECRKLARARGLKWDGTRNWANRDPGCLQGVADDHVNWNKNISGTAQGQSDVSAVPLCSNAPTQPQGPDQFKDKTIFILADSVEDSYCRQNYDNLGVDPARVCYKIDVGNEIQAQCVPGFRKDFVCDETAGWTHNPWHYVGRYEKTVGDKQYYTDGSASWLIHDTGKDWVAGVNANPELAAGVYDYEYYFYVCPTSYKFPSTLKINTGTNASIQVQEPEFCNFAFEVSVAPATPAGA